MLKGGLLNSPLSSLYADLFWLRRTEANEDQLNEGLVHGYAVSAGHCAGPAIRRSAQRAGRTVPDRGQRFEIHPGIGALGHDDRDADAADRSGPDLCTRP